MQMKSKVLKMLPLSMQRLPSGISEEELGESGALCGRRGEADLKSFWYVCASDDESVAYWGRAVCKGVCSGGGSVKPDHKRGKARPWELSPDSPWADLRTWAESTHPLSDPQNSQTHRTLPNPSSHSEPGSLRHRHYQLQRDQRPVSPS